MNLRELTKTTQGKIQAGRPLYEVESALCQLLGAQALAGRKLALDEAVYVLGLPVDIFEGISGFEPQQKELQE